MRRTKAAVSVEVKQVIGALCRLLAACGLEVVPPPETFRRAKFGGGPEVVRPVNYDTFITLFMIVSLCYLSLFLVGYFNSNYPVM